MSTTQDDALLSTGGPSLRAMSTIEARRFARSPVLIGATLVTLGIMVLFPLTSENAHSSDLLSWPVLPAFFIGLPSLLVAARLTRSTEGAAEALGTAPGTEARRTLALAIACFVPFGAGLVWLAGMLVVTAAWKPFPQDWWFGNLPDVHVWAVLVALGPVSCLGGALLGVLVGRWLRFPGAPAVVVVVLVMVVMMAQYPSSTGESELRLWSPWAMFHSGTDVDGTATSYSGNPVLYGLYQLALCGAATIAAVWHDRSARTRRLRMLMTAVVLAGLVSLGLAMTTGGEDRVSDPIPSKVEQ